MTSGTNACAACGFVNPGEWEKCALCGDPIKRVTTSYKPGDLIHGKFEVLNALGGTAMGEVYRVRHEALDVLRCVKLFRKTLLEDEVFKTDFLREARLSTRVHHRNVALVHDIDVNDDGRYYIVWEFVDGLTIRQRIRRYGRFPYRIAALLASQALSGLGHIHTRGLLHHNLSTENMMVTLDFEGQPALKITDLGVGRVVGGSSDGSDATQVGMYIGNPKYLSPEQLGMLGDQETIDDRSDLYCFAVVLYEMIAGVPPFTSATPQGYLLKHMMEPPPPFASVAPDVEVPPELQNVVLRALEKNRNDRFRSAAEFKKALEPYLDVSDSDRDQYAELISADLPSRQRATVAEPDATDGELQPTKGADLSLQPTSAEPPPEAWTARTVEEAFSTIVPDEVLPGTVDAPARDEDTEEQPVDVETIKGLEEAGDLDQLAALARQYTLGTPISDVVRNAIDAVESRLAEERRLAEIAAWEKAEREGTVEAWTAYLEVHSESNRADAAMANREEAREFDLALEESSSERWNAFLNAWPQGAHRAEARVKRGEAAKRELEESRERERLNEWADWERAKTAGTSAAWEHYLGAHPGSSRASQAVRNRDEARAFETAVAIGTLQKWDAFLAEWPEGAHRVDATDQRAQVEQRLEREELERKRLEQERLQEEADWAQAAAAGTSQVWEGYLEDHPSSHRAGLARAKRDEARDFEAIRDADELDPWRTFISTWPDGPHRAEAESRLAEIEERLEQERIENERIEEEADWGRAENMGTADEWERYLARHPASDRASQAVAFRDEARAFETAMGAGRLEEWDAFLEAWPDGVHGEEAKGQRDQLEKWLALERERIERERAAEEADWQRAEKSGKSEAWRGFVEAHPKSERIARARANLDESRAFENAEAADTLESWDGFLAAWPEGAHHARGERQRRGLEKRLERERRQREKAEEAADWKAATEEGSSAAWSAFAEAHPSSKRVERAFTNRDEAWAFETAEAADQVEDWNRFLEVWPRGAHRAEAVRLRDELARRIEEERIELERIAEATDWDVAEQEATSDAWAEYLAAHASSERADQASERRQEAEEYEAAIVEEDLERWDAFLAAWPDGVHRDQGARIRDALAERLAKEREKAEKERIAEEADWSRAEHERIPGLWSAYLSAHPRSERVAQAKLNLEEATQFQKALKADDLATWRAFVASWPKGPHAREAARTLDELERRHEEQRRLMESAAWDRAMGLGTSSAWEAYLEAHGDSERARLARSYHDEAVDFIATRMSNTIDAWKTFLEVWPDGAYQSQAIAALREAEQRQAEEQWRAESGAWDSALNRATFEGWSEFLERYPESARAREALTLQEQARDFDQARRDDTPEQWSAFIEKFPDGPYARRARESLVRHRERVAKGEFRRAMRVGTIEALEGYMASHPDSSYMAFVKDALEELRGYQMLAANDSEKAWIAFLERWPMGPHADQAREKVRQLHDAAEASRITRRRMRRVMIVIAAVIVVAVAGYFASRSSTVINLLTRPPTLTVDAQPWARVTSVRDRSGKDRLSSGPRITPFALALPAGDYDVVLEYGTPAAESRTVRVHIGENETGIVREDFAAVDARAFFEESGW